jgi:hypothetical protein
MTRYLFLTAAAAALSFGAGAASAQDLQGFQTPSHNIYCTASGPMDGGPAELRCDVQHSTARPRPTPRSCDLDYGDAFVLHPGGGAGLMCHGDTVADASDPVLEYGRGWSGHGMTCASQPTGLTCRNRQGHGFFLSRAAQTLF